MTTAGSRPSGSAALGHSETFESHERFGTHHQYTDTPEGTYFCTTHVEAGRDPIARA